MNISRGHPSKFHFTKRFLDFAPIGILLLLSTCQKLYFLTGCDIPVFSFATQQLLVQSITNEILPYIFVQLTFQRFFRNTYFLGFYRLCLQFCAFAILLDCICFSVVKTPMNRALLNHLNFIAVKATLSSPFFFPIAVATIVLVFYIYIFSKITYQTNFLVSNTTRSSKKGFVILFILLTPLIIPSKPYFTGDKWKAVDDALTSYIQKKQIGKPSTVNLAQILLYKLEKQSSANQMSESSDPNLNMELSYSDQEKRFLESKGLVKDHLSLQKKAPSFNRVILISIESLSRDLVRYYNKNIPEGTTNFLDSLIEKHVALNNYWTTQSPTILGLYATYLSRPIFDPQFIEQYPTDSIFTVLRKNKFKTMLVRGASEHYEHDYFDYPRWYRMDQFIGMESINQFLNSTRAPNWGWGLNDDTVYKSAIRLLKEQRNSPVFMAINTLDTHPFYYSGQIEGAECPKEVCSSNSMLIRSLYWTDLCLKRFITDLENEGLFDQNTLIVITADHSPNHGESLPWTKAADWSPQKIPAIFVTKNSERLNSVDRNRISSQIDLAPTILALIGINSPSSFWGTNIFESSGNAFSISNWESYLLFRFNDTAIPVPHISPINASDNFPTEITALWKWAHNKRTRKQYLKEQMREIAKLTDTTKSSLNWDLKIIKYENGWGDIRKDASISGSQISIGGKKYLKGIGVHANSSIKISLGQQYKIFTGHCGIDDATQGAGAARFRIESGGKILFQTGLMKGGDSPSSFIINVDRQSEIELFAEYDPQFGSNAAHGDWAELMFK